MKFRFILFFLFLILSETLTYSQNSERERLLAEANQSRFNDPLKSLKLYDYLLTNSNNEEAIAIEIKRIQINRLLARYQEAVEISQEIRSEIAPLSNASLKFEYWRELAMLYSDLDLKLEGEKLVKKAQVGYNRLSTEAQKKYVIDLQLLLNKYKEDKTPEAEIYRLQNILKEMNGEDARRSWLQYQIGTLYYSFQKDSAKKYFDKLIQPNTTSSLNNSAEVYSQLLDSIKIEDSVIQASANRDLFDSNLRLILLNNAIDFWEESVNPDSLIYFQKQLNTAEKGAQLEQRQAKVALLQHIYRQKKIAVDAENNLEKKRIGIAIGFLCLMLLIYFGYKVYSRNKPVKPAEEEASKSIVISDKTEEEILQKLKNFENSELFLDKQMRVATLAKQLDTNTRYLSTIINSAKNKTFNNYINSLRIQYILDKLQTDPKYHSYKISYLAEESGFASQSSFTTAFKDVTGFTPSAYIKKSTS
ncbi:helix-turn-helix domain-containing protein [Aequorivita capsosiphonis]|uniref:helix-turn-helix domain-containing protein n=1 Tax=Aequorivita capsosiphonis TaxID=487317 RepID=UPI000478FD29|nr:helix-turn-helix transcriptional regulator [Aequorivita capsosiphonis]